MAADQRTVTVHDAAGRPVKVTPEVARALEAGSYGPYTRDVDTSAQDEHVAQLEARVAELEEALDYVVAVGADQDAKLAELEEAATAPTPAGDDPMPEDARERKAWIGDDPARAQAALDDETQRGDQARKTVTDHARSVLDTSPNDPAGPGQED